MCILRRREDMSGRGGVGRFYIRFGVNDGDVVGMFQCPFVSGFPMFMIPLAVVPGTCLGRRGHGLLWLLDSFESRFV